MCHGNPSNFEKVSAVHLDRGSSSCVCKGKREREENCLQKSADTYPHTSLLVPALKSFTVNVNQSHPKWHVMKLTLSKTLLSSRYNRISSFVKLFSLVTTLTFQPPLSLWHLCFNSQFEIRKTQTVHPSLNCKNL